MIDNAIANAVKHGSATEIRLNVTSSGEGVEIAIDDNGTGVPEAERTAVFERFSRGSTASRSGSGLGLALVAQQAELHGGKAFCTPVRWVARACCYSWRVMDAARHERDQAVLHCRDDDPRD